MKLMYNVYNNNNTYAYILDVVLGVKIEDTSIYSSNSVVSCMRLSNVVCTCSLMIKNKLELLRMTY